MSKQRRTGARMIAEDCDRFTISELNQMIIRFIKGPLWESCFDDILDSDKDLSPAEVLKKRNSIRGLVWFFSQEKPEWMDPDEWTDITEFGESIGIRGINGKHKDRLDIDASPPNKNQTPLVTFTHPVMQSVMTSPGVVDDVWKDFSYPVKLEINPIKKGGFQYYFICPLSENGVPCRRKVSVLYLPPGAKYFGCRHCYNLSYASRNASGGEYIPISLLRIAAEVWRESLAKKKEEVGNKQ